VQAASRAVAEAVGSADSNYVTADQFITAYNYGFLAIAIFAIAIWVYNYNQNRAAERIKT
jgi:hypothetical protein